MANLNVDQIDFSGQTKRLSKVREKGKVERDVVISKDAAEHISRYVDSERSVDATAWNGSRALFLSVPFQAKKRDNAMRGRMSTRTLSYVVQKIADRAQVDSVHPHRFRHHV